MNDVPKTIQYKDYLEVNELTEYGYNFKSMVIILKDANVKRNIQVVQCPQTVSRKSKTHLTGN